MIGRLQKQKALSAHKTLIEASNQKIIGRIEQLKTQRQAAAQLRTKQAIQQQLSKVSLSMYLNCTLGFSIIIIFFCSLSRRIITMMN